MRHELIGLLQNDLKAFVRKALRKLDETVIDDDPYIDLVITHLLNFADGSTKNS